MESPHAGYNIANLISEEHQYWGIIDKIFSITLDNATNNDMTKMFLKEKLSLPLRKVIDFVPYRPVRPEYTVSASNLVHSTLLFRTGKNTSRTGLVPAVPVNFGQYRPVPGVPAGTEKSIFFFFF